jgi:hypothetical protein
MVLAGNKKYIAPAVLSLAVCAAANGLSIVASWRSNVASFHSERASYLIY